MILHWRSTTFPLSSNFIKIAYFPVIAVNISFDYLCMQRGTAFCYLSSRLYILSSFHLFSKWYNFDLVKCVNKIYNKIYIFPKSSTNHSTMLCSCCNLSKWKNFRIKYSVQFYWRNVFIVLFSKAHESKGLTIASDLFFLLVFIPHQF